MKRVLTALAVVVLVASVATGVLVWRLSRHPAPKYPEVSAFSNGQLVRVGPSLNCSVKNPTICEPSFDEGELSVTEKHPVQVSIPAAVAKAPWFLVLVYDDPRDTTLTSHRPDTTLAATVPTVDPRRGRLRQIVVQLRTVVQDQEGELVPVPHAEWSVRTVWP